MYGWMKPTVSQPLVVNFIVIANDKSVAAYFDALLEKGGDLKQAAYWIMGDIAALYPKNVQKVVNNRDEVDSFHFSRASRSYQGWDF
jgi:hypothetical protein